MLLLVMGLAVFTGQAAIMIRIIPSFGPPQKATSFMGYATNAVSLIKTTSTLPVGERAYPMDAGLLQHVVPEDLMTTTTVPFHRGVFSPTTPWNNERGGTIWWWVEITTSEEEEISLADISVVVGSSDPGNILGKTVSFDGAGVVYSSTSLGIQTNGLEITSGPASQQVQRVIVGIGSKSFPVSSMTDVQTVRDYIFQFSSWKTMIVVNTKGTSASLALFKLPPILRAIKSGDRFLVIAESNGDTMNYTLQTSAALSSAVWNSAGRIQAGQTNDMGLIQDRPMFFIRYAPFNFP